MKKIKIKTIKNKFLIDHSEFIENIAKIYKPKIYLELGLYRADTFGRIRKHAKRAIAVDLVILPGIEGELFQESTDTFFKHFDEQVDMIFIDADHSFDSVYKDLKNSLKILNNPGIIILHDTDPEHIGILHSDHCNDCYKILEFLEQNDKINAVTLPVSEAGLTIVTWKNQLRINKI